MSDCLENYGFFFRVKWIDFFCFDRLITRSDLNFLLQTPYFFLFNVCLGKIAVLKLRTLVSNSQLLFHISAPLYKHLLDSKYLWGLILSFCFSSMLPNILIMNLICLHFQLIYQQTAYAELWRQYLQLICLDSRT